MEPKGMLLMDMYTVATESFYNKDYRKAYIYSNRIIARFESLNEILNDFGDDSNKEQMNDFIPFDKLKEVNVIKKTCTKIIFGSVAL